MTSEKWTLVGMLLVPFSYILSALTAQKGLTHSEIFVVFGFSASALLFWIVRMRKGKS
jgi:hypothetical protein